MWNRAGSSPPSPQLDRPPIRFMAWARVSWASFESDPCDMAPVENRRAISLAGSTSSSGTGGPIGDHSSRSLSSVGGRSSTSFTKAPYLS